MGATYKMYIVEYKKHHCEGSTAGQYSRYDGAIEDIVWTSCA